MEEALAEGVQEASDEAVPATALAVALIVPRLPPRGGLEPRGLASEPSGGNQPIHNKCSHHDHVSCNESTPIRTNNETHHDPTYDNVNKWDSP